MKEEQLIVKVFKNGNFKILREIIYVLSITVGATFIWANLANSVENNTIDIEEHKIKIQELTTFKEETRSNVNEIKTDISYIRSILEGKYNN